jgi:hypothetical protein
MQANALCSLCGVRDETLDHLTLQCPFAGQVWYEVSQRLGFSIPVPMVTSTIPEWWPQAVEHLSQQDSRKANLVIMLTMRSLWLERNARVFERVSSPTDRTISSICSEWDSWVSSRRGFPRGIE